MILKHSLVVAAFRGAGAACGIVLGAQYVLKALLLCMLAKSASRNVQKAATAEVTSWVLVKRMPLGSASPLKSAAAPATPEPCTPRFTASGESDECMANKI